MESTEGTSSGTVSSLGLIDIRFGWVRQSLRYAAEEKSRSPRFLPRATAARLACWVVLATQHLEALSALRATASYA